MEKQELKVDLVCDIFFYCSVFSLLLGFILGMVAAAIEKNTLSFILVAICMVIAMTFAGLWVWVEYHKEELKKPKWQKDVERRMGMK